MPDSVHVEPVLRRQTDARDAYLLALGDALRPLADPVEIQATASRILGEHLDASRVAYFEMRGADYVIERDYTNDAIPLIGRFPVSTFGRNMLDTYTSGRTAIGFDVAGDSTLSAAERAAYAAVQVGAYIGVPLIKNGQFVVGLGVHVRGPRIWTTEEIARVEETAERTWAAVERARAEVALARSEEKYRTLFTNIDEAFALCELLYDADGRPCDRILLEVNPRYHEMIHSKASVGSSAREVFPEIEDYWFDRYHEVVATGNAIRVEDYSAGLDRWFDVYLSRVGGEGSHVFAAVFNDITERKRREANLREVERELREADRRKDEFLATLAHELRNPLAPMRNGLHFLRRSRNRSGTADADAVHEMMERQLTHMVRLVDDLMDVSRITRGRVELRTSLIDLASVLQSAIEASKPHIEAGEHELAVSLGMEPLILEADAVRLTQVFANLLNNAAKYTDTGGRIWLAAHRDGAGVLVSIRDNGIGIQAEMLSKVFDLFTQADRANSRGQGGLGIGLTLVRSMVDMHGGSIEAKSGGPGLGSEFLVRLPLAAQT